MLLTWQRLNSCVQLRLENRGGDPNDPPPPLPTPWVNLLHVR